MVFKELALALPVVGLPGSDGQSAPLRGLLLGACACHGSVFQERTGR